MGDNKKKIIIAAIVIVLVIVAIVGGVFTVMKSNRSANTNNTTIPNSAYVENTNIKNGNGNQVSTTTNISDNANVNENNNQNANQNANQNTATTWDDVNENTNVNTNTNGSKPVHDDMLGQDFDKDLCANTAKRAVEAFNTYNAGLLNNGDYLNAITPLIDSSRVKSNESANNIVYTHSQSEWIRNTGSYSGIESYIESVENVAVSAQKGTGEYFPVVMVTVIEIRNVGEPGTGYDWWKVIGRYRSRYVVELSPEATRVFSMVRSGSEILDSDVTGIYSNDPISSEDHITPSFEGNS